MSEFGTSLWCGCATKTSIPAPLNVFWRFIPFSVQGTLDGVLRGTFHVSGKALGALPVFRFARRHVRIFYYFVTCGATRSELGWRGTFANVRPFQRRAVMYQVFNQDCRLLFRFRNASGLCLLYHFFRYGSCNACQVVGLLVDQRRCQPRPIDGFRGADVDFVEWVSRWRVGQTDHVCGY